MMMHVLAGVAVWMVASVGLGLTFGRLMRGYAVSQWPARAPLADAETTPSYQQAA